MSGNVLGAVDKIGLYSVECDVDICSPDETRRA